MKDRILGATLAVAVVLGGIATAHEGHEHKVMGKVVTVSQDKIEVETADGKKVEAALLATTKYRRDKATVARTDVKVGERVVIVTIEEKGQKNVKQVLLGTASTEPAKHDDKKH
jgi:co-chaperonin GroES (HSP10)